MARHVHEASAIATNSRRRRTEMRPALGVLLTCFAAISGPLAQSDPTEQQLVDDTLRELARPYQPDSRVQRKQEGELTTRDVGGARDLALYEDGGHADLRYWARSLQGGGADRVFFEQRRARIRARDFIWSHWTSRRRGYFRITQDSVDTVSTSHIFIEPMSSGEWRVAFRVVRQNGMVDDFPDAMRVEPGDCDGNDGSCVLRFVDRTGMELHDL